MGIDPTAGVKWAKSSEGNPDNANAAPNLEELIKREATLAEENRKIQMAAPRGFEPRSDG
jgi:hypothetical protein